MSYFSHGLFIGYLGLVEEVEVGYKSCERDGKIDINRMGVRA